MSDVALTAPTVVPSRVSTGIAARLGSIFAWLFIGLIALVVATVAVIPRAMGAEPLTVLTGSMMPSLRPGDIVIVRPTPIAELQPGDVVTFQPISGDPKLNTHRIVNLVTDDAGTITSVITRGDANNINDAPIRPEQIKGRVAYVVPLVGQLTITRNAILAVGLIVGGGLLIYAASGIVSIVRNRDQQPAEIA